MANAFDVIGTVKNHEVTLGVTAANTLVTRSVEYLAYDEMQMAVAVCAAPRDYGMTANMARRFYDAFDDALDSKTMTAKAKLYRAEIRAAQRKGNR